MIEVQIAINTITRFLALRNIENLTSETIKKQCGVDKVDVIVVFGNELPVVVETACEAFQAGLCDYLLMCGGVGSSTKILQKRMQENSLYRDYVWKGTAGEIFADVARKIYKIPREKVLVKNTSTNSGENGQFVRQILRGTKILHRSILLMQDPLMQYRSFMSMKRFFPHNVKLISYAPFIPLVNAKLEFYESNSLLWDKSRFYELLMGEMWRLRDNLNGYGSCGRERFKYVDIPTDVENSYTVLTSSFQEYMTRCNEVNLKKGEEN